jgi:hypothetical protein
LFGNLTTVNKYKLFMSEQSPLSFSKFFLALGGLVLSSYTVYSLVNNVPKANAAAPCIVTLFGVQYDVAPLQPTGAHPGGNIFVCGTDMTAVYTSMHGTNVARMVPYLYIAPTPTPTATPTPIVTPTPSPTPIVTPTPTVTPDPTPSVTPTPTPIGSHEVNEQNEGQESHQGEKHKETNHDQNGHGNPTIQLANNERRGQPDKQN